MCAERNFSLLAKRSERVVAADGYIYFVNPEWTIKTVFAQDISFDVTPREFMRILHGKPVVDKEVSPPKDDRQWLFAGMFSLFEEKFFSKSGIAFVLPNLLVDYHQYYFKFRHAKALIEKPVLVPYAISSVMPVGRYFVCYDDSDNFTKLILADGDWECWYLTPYVRSFDRFLELFQSEFVEPGSIKLCEMVASKEFKDFSYPYIEFPQPTVKSFKGVFSAYFKWIFNNRILVPVAPGSYYYYETKHFFVFLD